MTSPRSKATTRLGGESGCGMHRTHHPRAGQSLWRRSLPGTGWLHAPCRGPGPGQGLCCYVPRRRHGGACGRVAYLAHVASWRSISGCASEPASPPLAPLGPFSPEGGAGFTDDALRVARSQRTARKIFDGGVRGHGCTHVINAAQIAVPLPPPLCHLELCHTLLQHPLWTS